MVPSLKVIDSVSFSNYVSQGKSNYQTRETSSGYISRRRRPNQYLRSRDRSIHPHSWSRHPRWRRRTIRHPLSCCWNGWTCKFQYFYPQRWWILTGFSVSDTLIIPQRWYRFVYTGSLQIGVGIVTPTSAIVSCGEKRSLPSPWHSTLSSSPSRMKISPSVEMMFGFRAVTPGTRHKYYYIIAQFSFNPHAICQARNIFIPASNCVQT